MRLIGSTDFITGRHLYSATGNMEQIMDSITNRLLVLPEDTIVYPGHGKSTIIKEEEPIYLELKPKDSN